MEFDHAGREILFGARGAEAQHPPGRKPAGHQHLAPRPGQIADRDGKVGLNSAGHEVASSGTNLAHPELSPIPQRRECAMKLATIMIAGTAALTILGSSAFAQQT